MKSKLIVFVSFTLVLFSCQQSIKKPNIVFIFTDDHATQAISAYGGMLANIAPTPNLDKLANEGMLFQRCMVTNSICGPSRASILTGKHSHANGFYQNENTVFDGQQFTFPKALQATGYQTAIVGKWHLGGKPTGFDYWEILPGQGAYYNPDFITKEGEHREEGYVTDIVTDKAKKWLNSRDKNKPFMLMVQHKAPHRNWMPAERHLSAFNDVTIPEPHTLFDDYEGRGTAARDQDMTIAKTMDMGTDLKVISLELGGRLSASLNRMNKSQRATWDHVYAPKNKSFLEQNLSGKELVQWKYQRYIKDYLRCIKTVDESVGELRAYLEANGLDKNTIIVYSSDQGFYLGEHGWFDKRFIYDESFKTPLMIKWPNKIKPGITNDEMVQNLDFAQTFLEAAMIDVPDDMQGESLMPLLKGENDKWTREEVYYHYYEYPSVHMAKRHYGIVTKEFKLVRFYYDVDEWELYDRLKDPYEMNNVYNDPDYRDLVIKLTQDLKEMRIKYKDSEELDKSFIYNK